MQCHPWVLPRWVRATALAATLLIILSVTARSAQAAIDTAPAAEPSAAPVVFVHDPDWPAYAQTEIVVNPEPPQTGRPTDICAWIVNTTGITRVVNLAFGVANFGIGLPFAIVGTQTVAVPPGARLPVCIVWVPRVEGHWCIQVVLSQLEFPDAISQRNIDIWEVLTPGVPAVTVFPMRNPLATPATIELAARPNPGLAGWGFRVEPALAQLQPGQWISATLVVTPPAGVMLGSRDYLVDVEASQVLVGTAPRPIGGFRKMDWPPVPLHIPSDPPYAESEISVQPYPPLADEPTRICVELRNLSDTPQQVVVAFEVSPRLGIGLPFSPIDHQTVVIPPHSRVVVCTTWIPPKPGEFCVRVQLIDPQQRYQTQASQRNLDVAEVLLPGVRSETEIPVGNPGPVTTTLFLTTTLVDPFFDVFVEPAVLPNMAPGEIRPVRLIVVPGQGPLPEGGTRVVDLAAIAIGERQEKILVGGIRKIFRPPVSLHRPEEPSYAESEISVQPYPPAAGEPVRICVELRNPTDVTQTVAIEVAVARFGIGLPFTPIDRRPVELPPHSSTRVCTGWVPPIGGHFCIQVILRQPGYRDTFSQRNVDVAEVLRPSTPDSLAFVVGNPLTRPATITLGLILHQPGWSAGLSSAVLPNVAPGAFRVVTLTVRPADDLQSLEDGTPVVDVEAYIGDKLLGGFRKVFRPPIPIHRLDDPPYAEREISVEPYPPRAGEPAELCVELRNPTPLSQTVVVEFAVANFGIGLPFHPIYRQAVTVPPYSLVKHCTTWVPPFSGHFCVQVSLFDPAQRYAVVRSQRNLDVDEVLQPGQPSEPFVFPVGNPLDHPANLQLAVLTRLPGWEAVVEPRVLPDMQPGETRPVTLTVVAPRGPLPPDDTPVADIEAYAEGQLIGGFRKLYRPPVPIHRPQDPVYAESEISIQPYPPREREPTEICVDVRNPTDRPQTFTVTFSVANFGIGLPFHDIARPIAVTLPPHSLRRVCVTWVPPFGGHFCAQVTLQAAGHPPVWSQRNLDVSEILQPGVPSTITFPVGNPSTRPATLTLGTVLRLERWEVSLSTGALRALQPGEVRPVTLVVTPPVGLAMPEDATPVVDVEAYLGGDLVGGIRKIYRPPVPIHRSQDPVYAESEIFVDPYPTRPHLPTLIGAVVFNPGDQLQRVTVTFGIARFGIGLPFTTTGILSPSIVLAVPPHGAAQARTLWIPWLEGHFCVQILLESAGHEPVWSQRNIDVGEPLRPDQPHRRIIEVRNPAGQAATITLALVSHRGPDWSITLTPTMLVAVPPGAIRPVTLTVQPPSWQGLADEQPIVDVEAYINGRLIGGVRKIAKPPVPLHKPQDPPYAESEIGVQPDPPRAGRPVTFSTAVMNTADTTQTIRVRFGVANFGVGIPFTNANIVPTQTTVTLGPGVSATVAAVWTPPGDGHWCLQVILEDGAPGTQYPPQRSQRNVDVERGPFTPCQPFTKTFVLHNPTPLVITITIGASAINLPAGWTYSTDITQTMLLAFQSVTVTLTITPPCASGLAPALPATLLDTGGASGPPVINVEGYDDAGALVGGVQVQLAGEGDIRRFQYLPLVTRH